MNERGRKRRSESKIGLEYRDREVKRDRERKRE